MCVNCDEPIAHIDPKVSRTYWVHNQSGAVYCKLPALIAKPRRGTATN